MHLNPAVFPRKLHQMCGVIDEPDIFHERCQDHHYDLKPHLTRSLLTRNKMSVDLPLVGDINELRSDREGIVCSARFVSRRSQIMMENEPMGVV